MAYLHILTGCVVQSMTSEWDSQLTWDNPNNFDIEVTCVIFDFNSIV